MQTLNDIMGLLKLSGLVLIAQSGPALVGFRGLKLTAIALTRLKLNALTKGRAIVQLELVPATQDTPVPGVSALLVPMIVPGMGLAGPI
jgi:hypothetical protein